MFDPFEKSFEQRLMEDPEHYNRYVRDTHKRVDQLINTLIKNSTKATKKTVVQKPLSVKSNPRATKNGSRSANDVPRAMNSGPRINRFDKGNSDKLKEASRNLNDELYLTPQINTKDFKSQKETAKHFMKTAKEYGLL